MNTQTQTGAGLIAAVIFAAIPAFAQNVVITNTTAQPIPVKEVRVAGTTPLQIDLTINTKQGAYSSDKLFVPTGQVAVIEHASVYGICSANTFLDLALLFVNPLARPAGAEPATVHVGTVDAAHNWVTQPVRLYLAAGATLHGAGTNNLVGSCTATVTLTGHWEDVPLTGIVVGGR